VIPAPTTRRPFGDPGTWSVIARGFGRMTRRRAT
jgi:hypothetical protein